MTEIDFSLDKYDTIIVCKEYAIFSTDTESLKNIRKLCDILIKAIEEEEKKDAPEE